MARDTSSKDVISLYLVGKSIPEISEETGVPLSTVRFRLKAAGVLRTRAEGVAMAGQKGKLGSGMRGKSRTFSKDHRAAIQKARAAWGEANATGTSTKPNGYIEITRGEHKGKGVHVLVMERRIGRLLLPDEVVHHIDGNKQNNDADNLALMTRAAHSRLHRFEESLQGISRERNENGTWR